MKLSSRTPLLLFYLLVGYVLLQFGWWAYELATLHKKLAALQSTPGSDEIVNPKWLMILGEGTVFLIILLIAANIIRRSFNREKEITAQQKNFLLSVTHELKSPLASTRLQLETLLKRQLSKEQETQILKNALSETERLTTLVENILTASRIEHNEISILRSETNLSELIDDIVENYKSTFNPVQKINIDADANILYKVDRDSFRIIMYNLIENACKYSPHDSVIQIVLFEENRCISLTFHNQGTEIPESEKENIFKKFYRLQNEDTRSAKGTGLGLFITKFLVEKHNGMVKVTNDQPGTTFKITFKKDEH